MTRNMHAPYMHTPSLEVEDGDAGDHGRSQKSIAFVVSWMVVFELGVEMCKTYIYIYIYMHGIIYACSFEPLLLSSSHARNRRGFIFGPVAPPFLLNARSTALLVVREESMRVGEGGGGYSVVWF